MASVEECEEQGVAVDVPTPAQKKQRGQFFTRHADVHEVMSSLVTHGQGRVVEPSAGQGHLVAVLEDTHPGLVVDAVELDSRLSNVCATQITVADFFTWSQGREGVYQVAFGNPPYVAWRDVEHATTVSAAGVKSGYSEKTNLYHLFIDRLVDLLAPGGEMVLIVPKEWLYATSAAPLREKLAAQGAVTHVVDCGEEKLFADASVPALLIFRWQKQLRPGRVRYASGVSAALAGQWGERTLTSTGDRWMLLPDDLVDDVLSWGVLGDQYVVRVGLVTGMDRVFKLQPGHRVEDECVQWQVSTSRTLVPFINVNHVSHADLLPPGAAAVLRAHEGELRARRIASFDDSNWWKYGAVRNAEHMASHTPRFFALVKTRSAEPFFTVAGATHYTGGVLGVFAGPNVAVSIPTAVRFLNSSNFRPVLEAMFLTSNDKVSFQPSTLSVVPFPRTESAAVEFLSRSGV